MIDRSVILTIYILFILGLVLIFYPCFEALFRRFRLKRRLNAARRSLHKPGGIMAFFEELLFSVFGKERLAGVFLFILAVLFLFVLLISVKSLSFPAAIGAALICSAFPVLVLYAKCENDRNKASREGISLISDLYRNYRISNKNIYEAMQLCVEGNGDYPICRKQMYKLLLRLREASGHEEVKDCIRLFSSSLGTLWGYMLASCIRLSAERGIDISAGLKDIADQLNDANKWAEQRKRLNGESARMGMILVPVLYAGSIFASSKYLGVSLHDFMNNQFFTSEGLLLFLSIVFLFIANIVFIQLVMNGRIDY